MEEKKPTNTVLEVQNGTISLKSITDRIDKAIPKIVIKTEVKEDGKVSK